MGSEEAVAFPAVITYAIMCHKIVIPIKYRDTPAAHVVLVITVLEKIFFVFVKLVAQTTVEVVSTLHIVLT